MGRGESEIRAAWRRHVCVAAWTLGSQQLPVLAGCPLAVFENDRRLCRCCVESHPLVYVGGGDSSACLV